MSLGAFRVLTVVSLALVVGVTDAEAISFKTFAFTGVVTGVRENVPVLDGSIVAGTRFGGFYTFDPGALDTVPGNPSFSRFVFPTALGYGLRMWIGNYDLRPDPGRGSFSITVHVDNEYSVQSVVEGIGTLSPVDQPIVALTLAAPIFATDALPLSLPPLATFTGRSIRIDEGLAGGERRAFEVGGRLTTFSEVAPTPIPEPSTLVLVGTSTLGLMWLALRRRGAA
jgi:PEP-CTERM motif